MVHNGELLEKYQRLNKSFRRKLVFRVGIDAGFFTEYTAMINAMLWCLVNKVEFRLYSDHANFGYSEIGGWNDYFNDFCAVDHHSFHSKYNFYKVPSLCRMVKTSVQSGSMNANYLSQGIKWLIKRSCTNVIGSVYAFLKYGPHVLLTFNVSRKELPDYFNIPELGLKGTYLDAFRMMVDISWHFNENVLCQIAKETESLSIPDSYASCQIRGGDKVSEVELIKPEQIIEKILALSPFVQNIFVLSDDYRIIHRVRQAYPQLVFYSLCAENEKGYVNSDFCKMKGEMKRQQMCRLLASFDIILNSDFFVGSITTGPSYFALKYLFSTGKAVPVDTSQESIPKIVGSTVRERGKISMDYMNHKA